MTELVSKHPEAREKQECFHFQGMQYEKYCKGSLKAAQKKCLERIGLSWHFFGAEIAVKGKLQQELLSLCLFT